MSDGPSRRSTLFEAPQRGDDVLAAARNGDETVGAALARVRRANGLELSDIAQHLRIRETFLVALEDGDLIKLPGNAYAIGFVRSYANLLGVNGEEAVTLFKEQRAGETDPAALVFPEPVAESRIPKGAILFISVLLAVGAYGGWYYMSAHDMDLADLVPEVPAGLRDEAPDPPADTQTATTPAEDAMSSATVPPPATVTVPKPEPAAPDGETAPGSDSGADTGANSAAGEEAVPPPAAESAPAPAEAEPSVPSGAAAVDDSAPAPANEAPPRMVESVPQPPPVRAPRDAETTGDAAGPAAAAPAAEEIAPPRMGESVPQPPPVRPPRDAETTGDAAGPAAETEGGAAQVARTDATIELHAKSDSWVQIRGRDGQVVLMRILRTGDSYTVPDQPGLRLMTGNAGAIEIIVDGETVPSIGPVGAVRRDVALDPARLKAGTAVDR